LLVEAVARTEPETVARALANLAGLASDYYAIEGAKADAEEREDEDQDQDLDEDEG
jgi:hypothetical protein